MVNLRTSPREARTSYGKALGLARGTGAAIPAGADSAAEIKELKQGNKNSSHRLSTIFAPAGTGVVAKRFSLRKPP
jgi:hypothetical protein